MGFKKEEYLYIECCIKQRNKIKTVSLSPEQSGESIKVYANDRQEIMLRSSTSGETEKVSFAAEANAASQLRELVVGKIEELLSAAIPDDKKKPATGQEDKLFSEDPNEIDKSELFDSVEEVKEEDLEALPDVGI